MNNICAYFDYDVKFSNKYSYHNEDNDFSDDEENFEIVINGWVLLDMLSELLKEEDTVDFWMNKNIIQVEQFNSISGETASIKIEFIEMEENRGLDMKSYNKLVRDKIPDIIKQQGMKPVFDIAKYDSQYESYLRLKLREELDELLLASSTEEFIEEEADLLEVLSSYNLLRGTTFSEVMQEKAHKLEERGGFSKRIILKKVE